MFLRRMGQKILLLHSYRDGTGRVCQRRLGHFENHLEAEARLGDAGWQREFRARYPDLDFDGARLGERARELGSGQAPQRKQTRRPLETEEQLERALRQLRRLVEQAPQLRGRVAAALLDLSRPPTPEESALQETKPSRRRRFERHDPEAATHLQALEQSVRSLEEQGRLEESCRLQGELAARFPGPDTWLDYGRRLQQLGRAEEAIAQYSRLPARQSLRHYQIASVLCAQGKPKEALEPLLLGLSRERKVAEALIQIEKNRDAGPGGEYWREYGKFWDGAGRKFFLAVYNQPLVKMRLSQAQRLKVRPRRLFRDHALSVVLALAQR